MPQLQLPFFPHGVTEITANLAFGREEDHITYYHGDTTTRVITLVSGAYVANSIDNPYAVAVGVSDTAYLSASANGLGAVNASTGNIGVSNNMTGLYFGQYFSQASGFIGGHIERLTVYPKRFDNATLALLSGRG